MNIATKLLVLGLVSLLPLQALAADEPKSDSSAKPAAGELHGFDKYWSMIDPTGKGFITKDEWLAHQTSYFDEIDTNHDGKITKDEMKAHDEKRQQHFQEMRAKHQGMMKDKEKSSEQK